MTRVPADEQRLREIESRLVDGEYVIASGPPEYPIEVVQMALREKPWLERERDLLALLRVREQEAGEARVLYVDRLIERDAAVREAAELREALGWADGYLSAIDEQDVAKGDEGARALRQRIAAVVDPPAPTVIAHWCPTADEPDYEAPGTKEECADCRARAALEATS